MDRPLAAEAPKPMKTGVTNSSWPLAYEFCHQGYSKDLTVAPPGPIDFDIPTRIKIVNKFSGVVIDKSSGRSLANVAVYDLVLPSRRRLMS